LIHANDNFKPNAIRFSVEPRLLPPVKAARRLHLTLTEFDDKLAVLLDAGFPGACPITGYYDSHAIEAWQDRRSGLAGTVVASAALNADDVVMRRLAANG
jgi:hypothetical protein